MPRGPVRPGEGPWETINVADDPAYAEARQEMADLLKQGWKAALPQKDQ